MSSTLPRSFLTLRTVSSSFSTLGKSSMDRREEVGGPLGEESVVGVASRLLLDNREAAASTEAISVLSSGRPWPLLPPRSVILRGSLSPISLKTKVDNRN